MKTTPRRSLLGLCLVAMGCAMGCGRGTEAPDTRDGRIRTDRAHLFAVPSTLWKTPSDIPVCWETGGFTREKGWVTSAIQGSWEKAAPHVHFTGWAACTTDARGIRILV